MKANLKLDPEDRRKFEQTTFRVMRGIESGVKSGMEIILDSAKKFGGANSLKVKSGSLRDSISVSIKKEGDDWVGYLGSDSVYAKIHEYGGQINSRFSRWLVFKTDSGGWRKVSQVTIPPRPFLRPAIENNKQKFKDNLNVDIISAWKGRLMGLL